jgi:hypothetical protein
MATSTLQGGTGAGVSCRQDTPMARPRIKTPTLRDTKEAFVLYYFTPNSCLQNVPGYR